MTAKASTLNLMDLYSRWEHGNWSATDIDFSQDVQDWAEMTDTEREAVWWICSLFFFGEDEVTDTLAPLAAALWTDEQRYVLATQQVDEARHSVFFHRFFHEVLACGPHVEDSLAQATSRAQANPSFARIFSHLRYTTSAVQSNPGPRTLAAAITNYHVLVEATLAQQGQRFLIQDICAHRMPGLRAGLEQVEHDEHRHIAFGLKVLADLLELHPDEARAGVYDTLHLLAPHLVAVFQPPRAEYITQFGTTRKEIITQGLRSLTQKLGAVGLPLNAMPSYVLPVPFTDVEELVERILELEAYGILPDPNDATPVVGGDERAERALVTAVAHGATPVKPMTLIVQVTDGGRWAAHLHPFTEPHIEPTAASGDVTISAPMADLVGLAIDHRPSRRLRMSASPAMWRSLPATFPAVKVMFRERLHQSRFHVLEDVLHLVR